MKSDVKKPVIAISMGDPAGCGPEVLLKALSNNKMLQRKARFVVVGDYGVLRSALDITGSKVELVKIREPGEAPKTPGKIGVIDLGLVDLAKLAYGKPTEMGGKASFEYIKVSVGYAVKGLVDALVTMPISKESINMAGYNYPGHTEILSELTNSKDVRMMLVTKRMKVAHVTTHVPLSEAIKLVKYWRVLKTIDIVDYFLNTYFGLERPRIAVAGLNPHAGEKGLFGKEEVREIEPAVRDARKHGILASGPYPPDTLFYRAYHGREFDAVIAMYHDQGHIPVKLAGFFEGVNLTLGLPIVRTSPDHGTAWDIAGKGVADERPTINAIKLALLIIGNLRKKAVNGRRRLA